MDVMKLHCGPPASKVSNIGLAYQKQDRLSLSGLLILLWKPELGHTKPLAEPQVGQSQFKAVVLKLVSTTPPLSNCPLFQAGLTLNKL